MNTKRRFTKEVLEEVWERDGGCVVCGAMTNLDKPHHAYYGGIDAIRTPNRNDADQLVTICVECHRDIHENGNREARNHCKEYLQTYYNTHVKENYIQK